MDFPDDDDREDLDLPEDLADDLPEDFDEDFDEDPDLYLVGDLPLDDLPLDDLYLPDVPEYVFLFTSLLLYFVDEIPVLIRLEYLNAFFGEEFFALEYLYTASFFATEEPVGDLTV